MGWASGLNKKAKGENELSPNMPLSDSWLCTQCEQLLYPSTYAFLTMKDWSSLHPCLFYCDGPDLFLFYGVYVRYFLVALRKVSIAYFYIASEHACRTVCHQGEEAWEVTAPQTQLKQYESWQSILGEVLCRCTFVCVRVCVCYFIIYRCTLGLFYWVLISPTPPNLIPP